MSDEKGTDDKIIAVHVDDPEYAHYRDAADLPRTASRRFSVFSSASKVLEQKTVDVERIRGRAEAEQIIHDAVRFYQERIAPSRPGRSGGSP